MKTLAARLFGTRVILPQHQADVIELAGGNSPFYQAMAANLVVAAIDLASVFLPADAFVDDPKAIHELIHTVFTDVAKAIAGYAGTGQLDEATMMDLLTVTVASTVKGMLNLAIAALEGSAEDAGFIARQVNRLGRVGTLAAKVIKGTVDVLGKVSSVGQAAERASGILLPNSLALERSLFVVGQPFGPVIDGFEATRGRAGDIISIHGENFPAGAGDVSVVFCQFEATGNPPQVAVSLPAEVITASARTLVVRVPVGGQSTFQNGLAFIRVTDSRCHETDTRRLPAGRTREFLFEPLPQPALVVNSPLLPDSLMHVTGTNFTANGRTPESGIIDGIENLVARVTHATETDLLLILPSTIQPGPHTLTLRYGGEPASSPVPFVVLPGLETEPPHVRGLTIGASSLAMVNVPAAPCCV